MGTEVLSWREESWWERRLIPLGSYSFSPRQIFLLAVFGGLGDLISVPIPLTAFGIIYLGKLIPVMILLVFGFVLGSQRVKMIPVEIQLFIKATRNKALEPATTTIHPRIEKKSDDEKPKGLEL